MTDIVLVAVITTLGLVTATSITAFFGSRKTRNEVKKSRDETKQDLNEIHVLVNGRLTQALTEIAALRSYIDSRVPLQHGETSEQAVPQHQPRIPSLGEPKP